MSINSPSQYSTTFFFKVQRTAKDDSDYDSEEDEDTIILIFQSVGVR
jgi:hypothetical protein